MSLAIRMHRGSPMQASTDTLSAEDSAQKVRSMSNAQVIITRLARLARNL